MDDLLTPLTENGRYSSSWWGGVGGAFLDRFLVLRLGGGGVCARVEALNVRETDFQNDILRLARLMGLLVYHTYDSRRSEAGFPDLTIVGGNRVIFRELKSDSGRLSPVQSYWLAALIDAGQDAKVWHPADWAGITQELKALDRVTVRAPEPSQAQLRKMLKRRTSKS